jgi:hypothetical protein
VLVAASAEAYRFVTQPERGTRVGRSADHWGNDTFAEPTPVAPVAMAPAHHDAG